jgi:hypothetical protein
MSRPSEICAISAAVLLILSFVSRLSARPTLFSIVVRQTSYGFAPNTIFLAMAAVLAVSAAMYAFWPLQMNVKAGAWHSWVTVGGIAVFWICFYLFPVDRSLPEANSYMLVLLLGQLTSLGAVLLAQIVFVGNLVVAVVQLRGIGIRP